MIAKLQHILCVDDEEDILDVAKMCLEMVAGFQVSCCSRGKEAIERVRDINPDLILLDVMMPDMDGPSTLRELRKISLLETIPIVFMTARVHPAEVAQYLALGASGVVPKPFDPMRLSDEITKIWKKFHEQ